MMGGWTSKTKHLHRAVETGDMQAVITLVESGTSVNGTLNYTSPLYAALQHGHSHIASYLVTKGADLDNGYFTETPLHCACRTGNAFMVDLLLKRGANLNATDHNNCTPLWVAVASQKMDAVNILVSQPKVDLDFPCKERFMKEGVCSSPLCEAISVNNVHLATILRSRGADIEQPDHNGQRPIHRACFLGFLDMMHFLVFSGCDIDAVDDENITPIYLACEKGFIDIAKLLLKSGCNPNIKRNKEGWRNKNFSPLHVAVQGGHVEVVRALCDAGVDVNATETLGQTPLFHACEKGYLEIVKVLIASGADVNHVDAFGEAPLFYALQTGQRQIKKRLKRVNALRSLESECIMQETKVEPDSFNVQAVEMLLNAGANLRLALKNGFTATHCSIFLGFVDTSCIMLQHGARVLTSDFNFSKLADNWDNVNMIKLLMNYSMDFHVLGTFLVTNVPKCLSPQACKWLNRELRNPPSLLSQCRQTIRRILQYKTESSIFPLINALPVPAKLKQYLHLQDMYDDVFQNEST